MSKKSSKYPTFKTPVGRLVYPFLQEARDYEGDEKFAYSTGFVLAGEEAAKLEQFVDGLLAQAMQQFKTKKVFYVPYGEVLDEDENIVDGETLFKFKVAATTETKKGKTWDRKPAIFMLDGAKCELKLGGGTMARIAYQTYLWKNPGGVGVTLQPTGVQVHTLVELGNAGRNAADFGFENESVDDGEGDEGAVGPQGQDF